MFQESSSNASECLCGARMCKINIVEATVIYVISIH